MSSYQFDVLIIGSGLAGMTLALHLAETLQVGLITKRDLLEGSSTYAQGGIAAVLDTGDSIEKHIEDTLIAGAGLCNKETTRSFNETVKKIYADTRSYTNGYQVLVALLS